MKIIFSILLTLGVLSASACPLLHSLQPRLSMGGNLENMIKITLDCNSSQAVDWVDCDVMNPATREFTKFRMNPVGSNLFEHRLSLLDLPLIAQQTITFKFTYSIGGIRCDSDTFSTSRNLEQPVIVAPQLQPILASPVTSQLTCPALPLLSHQVIKSGNVFTITFNGNSQLPTDWVDIHFKINQGELMNHRMLSLGVNSFELSGITLNPGETLSYFFTYCVEGVDCNTEMYSYVLSLPQPIIERIVEPALAVACPVLTDLRHQVTQIEGGSIYKVSFDASSSNRRVDWVDLHYHVNSKELTNLRMTSIGSNHFTHQTPILLEPGDILNYFFTYCTENVDCDTDTYSFSVPLLIPAAIVEPVATPLVCPVLPSLTQQLIPSADNIYKWIFNGNTELQIDWVDLHFRIDSGDLINYRMRSLGGGNFEYFDLLPIAPGQKLEYFFTYCANKVDCDTQLYSYEFPQPQPILETELPALSCPVLVNPQYQVVSVGSHYGITFDANSPLSVDWVDVHFNIDNGELLNVRMVPTRNNIFTLPQSSAFSLSSSSVLQYYFTYCVNHVDCDTAIQSYSLPQLPQAIVETPAPSLSCPVLNNFQHQVLPIGSQYGITFDANSPLQVDWVDVHFSIDNGDLVNLRMIPTGNNLFSLPQSLGFNLSPTSVLKYFFTYCVAHVDCDTPLQTYSLPLPQPIVAAVVSSSLQCPVLTNFQHQLLLQTEGNSAITFDGNFEIPIDWVDIHINVDNQQLNYRMRSLGNNRFEQRDLIVPSGSSISYFFTYCVSGVDCDTPLIQAIGQPSILQPIVQAVLEPTPINQLPAVTTIRPSIVSPPIQQQQQQIAQIVQQQQQQQQMISQQQQLGSGWMRGQQQQGVSINMGGGGQQQQISLGISQQQQLGVRN